MDKTFLTCEYYAETMDERTKGSVSIRRDTIVAAYTIAGFRSRTLILTETGLKFAVKGKLGSLDLSSPKPKPKVLSE